MNAATEMNAEPRPAAAGADRASGLTMRAIVHPRYGEPDVLAYEEVARPSPKDDEVLVRVHAAAASIGDHHMITGKPYLIRLSPFGGLPRPKNRVPGACFAGRVEAVGAKVTSVRPGDEVYGQALSGAFAEYVAIPAKLLAPKPKGLSFEETAAVPWAIAALQGLRDAGGLKAGQKVLINGASGAVGTWAVQIAKAMGAHVTAVCSARNVDRMRELGADEVIDYTKSDFVEGGARFDVMLDTAGNRTISECVSVLSPTGTYVACSGGGGDWVGPMFRLAAVLITSLFSRRKLKTFLASPNRDDLVALNELIEAGKARPIIERRYALSEAAEALRHVGEGRSQGQTVLRVAE